MNSSGPALLLEIQLPDGTWARVNHHRPTDPPGSMSDNRDNGERHLIVFACNGDTSVIVRSAPARDVEPTPLVRLIDAGAEGERLATLSTGQSFEITVYTDVSRAPRTIRFTHKDS